MSKLEELCDDLAMKALDLEEQSGDETVIKKIADSLGSSSPTMEETFLTAVRIRRADRRARRLIESLAGGGTVPELPPKPVGDDDPGGH